MDNHGDTTWGISPIRRRRGELLTRSDVCHLHADRAAAVHHPAIVVVWRGQPGRMFEDDDPETANTLSFSGGTDFSRGPSLVPLPTVSVKQGAVRLEIAYRHETRELTVNGIPVDLPEGHDVVLVDDVDVAPVVVGTVRIGGSEPEWVETNQGVGEFSMTASGGILNDR